jgi:adenylylsulfate kinase-like enzyme
MMTSHATSTETEAAKNVRRTVLLLMGVSGCGKTTIAVELPCLLGWLSFPKILSGLDSHCEAESSHH